MASRGQMCLVVEHTCRHETVNTSQSARPSVPRRTALSRFPKRYNLGIMMFGSTISHYKLGEGRGGTVCRIRYLLQQNIPQSACLGGNHSNAKTGS